MPRRPHLTHCERRLAPTWGRGVVACLLLLPLVGCGGDEGSAACQKVVKALPSTVAGQKANGDRAWGDPKIQLTCGVGKPNGFTKTSKCQNTDGLDWYVPEDEIGSSPVDITLTTVGRSPRIQVQVPKDYWPPVSVQSDLTQAILGSTKKTTPCV